MRFVFVALGLACASASTAQTYFESGDAGALPASAQIVSGSGALSSLNGILDPGDVDMFGIRITGGGTFSATSLASGIGNPQLFLFTSAGLGVYANDDIPADFQPRLPAGHALTPTAPGLYYLAISRFNADPISAGEFIFPDTTTPIVVGPTGASGHLPVTGWTPSPLFLPGSYSISLTGAEFASAVIPEPQTYALLLAGLVLILVRRKKIGIRPQPGASGSDPDFCRG